LERELAERSRIFGCGSARSGRGQYCSRFASSLSAVTTGGACRPDQARLGTCRRSGSASREVAAFAREAGEPPPSMERSPGGDCRRLREIPTERSGSTARVGRGSPSRRLTPVNASRTVAMKLSCGAVLDLRRGGTNAAVVSARDSAQSPGQLVPHGPGSQSGMISDRGVVEEGPADVASGLGVVGKSQ
jgi:hypothetical protein